MSFGQSLKLCVPALLLLCASAAAYADPTYTVTNSNGGDGYVVGSVPTFQLYGADNGASGNYTTYVATFTTATTETFSWSYSTADCCGSGWDPAGYVLNGVFTQLSTDYFGVAGLIASSGSTTVNIPAGGTFGWYVYSPDSVLGRGELALSGVTVATTPEPSSLMLLGTGLLGAVGVIRRKVSA